MRLYYLLFCFLLVKISLAQSIFSNSITGSVDSGSSPYTTNQTYNTGITVSGISKDSELTGVTATDRFAASGWASTFNVNARYFEFTLTPLPGRLINFLSFQYTGQTSTSNPPNNFALRSSIDGYAANIGTATATGTTISLSGASFQGISSAVTFRFYAWGGSNTGATFSINDFTFNGTVVSGKVSATSGDWNVASTWSPVGVPASGEVVTIQNGHTVYTSTTITRSAATTVNGAFELRNGGYATGTPFTYNSSTGSLRFNAGTGSNYYVLNGHSYWPTVNGPFNVYLLSGDLTMADTAARTVNGLFQIGGVGPGSGVNMIGSGILTLNGQVSINTYGYFNAAPIYGSSSILSYQSGGVYGRGLEWSHLGVGTIGVTRGYPNHVTITANTTLDYNNGNAQALAKACHGNLTINSGSALYMDYGPSNNGGALTVNGNLVNSGSFTLGDGFGDDLVLLGNFTSTGAFNPNNRAVIFNKNGGSQTVNGTSLTFHYLNFGSNGSRTVTLNADLAITAPLAGSAITFNSASDIFNIATQKLTIGTDGISNQVVGSGSFQSTGASTLTLRGNGNIGTLRFTNGSSLNYLTMNRQAGVIGMNLGSPLLVNNYIYLDKGLINLSNGDLSCICASASSISGSSDSYVIADANQNNYGFIRYFMSASSLWYTLPIGDHPSSANGAQYSLIQFRPSTLTSSSYGVKVQVADAVHPEFNGTNVISRYFKINPVGTFPATGTLEIKGSYLPVDVQGTESSMYSNRYNGTEWANDGPLSTNSYISYVTDYSKVQGDYAKGLSAQDIHIEETSTGTDYLSGSTYTFTPTLTGQTVTATFTITNVGQSPLTFSAPTISGSGYSLNPAFNTSTLQALLSRTFTVQFTATSSGIYTGSISIPTNDTYGNENPYIINFTIVVSTPLPEINVVGIIGANPTIASGDMTPSGLDNTLFDNRNIGASQTKSFQIQNTGTGPLNINNITFTGLNPPEFSHSITSFPQTIAPSDVLNFTVTFSPIASGTREAIVNINHNDYTGNENPYYFKVQGTGDCVTSALTITPNSGPVGTEITINAPSGNFYGATVLFNSVPATTVLPESTTQIKVVIPPGAESGTVSITNFQGCTYYASYTVLDGVANSCEGSGAGGTPTKIFISEVTDSNSGGLSYVELYNPTAAAINLASPVQYSIQVYNNGSATVTNTINLTGTIPANGMFILAMGGATCTSPAGSNGSYANQTTASGGVNFNTNEHDYIALVENSTIIDSWGIRQATNWAPAFIGTHGAQFIRKPDAVVPKALYNENDWVIIDFPGTNCADNNYSNIGTHDYERGNPPVVQPPVLTISCKNSTISVTATEGFAGGKALTYQWYVAAPGASTWTAVTNAGVYSGATTNTLTISNVSGLVNYQFYCEVREDLATCNTPSTAVKIDLPTVATWDGFLWTPAAPNSNQAAILAGSYNTLVHGSFECCSLTINTGNVLTIQAGDYVKIENDLSVPAGAKLDVMDSGSLVMVSNSGVVSGTNTMSMRRKTRPMNRFDYTYWSTPILAANFTSTFAGWRLDYAYTFNTANFSDVTGPNGIGGPDGFDDNGNVWTSINPSLNMIRAKGYAIMGPTNLVEYPAQPEVTFTGTFNNGVIGIALALSQNTANATDDYNLVGNPYPSPIHAPTFISTNTNISGTLYFWTHCLPISASNPGPGAMNFSTDDYAVYNLTGGTQASPNCGLEPSDYIASGQGFFVEAVTATQLLFNNSMRSVGTGLNGAFFRSQSSETDSLVQPARVHDRIWLNLKQQDGLFSQLLLGYSDHTTLGYDRAYDGMVNEGGNSVSLYSFIDDEAYRIQARPRFDTTDQVPLGFKTQLASSFSIEIHKTDGLFTGDQEVILEDKFTQTFHNLKEGPYTFTSLAGNFDNRFLLRYQTPLGVDSATNDSGLVLISDKGKLGILSHTKNMVRVDIFDVLGRKISSTAVINQRTVEISAPQLSEQIVVVRIVMEDGSEVNRKVRL